MKVTFNKLTHDKIRQYTTPIPTNVGKDDYAVFKAEHIPSQFRYLSSDINAQIRLSIYIRP